MRWIQFILPLLLGAWLSGCADVTKDTCGHRVLLLWPNANGQSTFQAVDLPTLPNPYEVRGPAADVYFAASLTENGFEGSVAHPHLTRSGDVCVPTDTGSAEALSVYAQFERLKNFDSKLGIADQLSWPRKVGVEINVRGTNGSAQNNAHYFGREDAMAIIPYSLNGLPLTMNHGVIAHEHFHAHFQERVLNPLNAVLAHVTSVERFFYSGMNLHTMADEMQKVDLGTNSGVNNFVVRGWNEGLADFYGATYVNNPDFLRDSLSLFAEGRRLDGPPLFMATGPQFREALVRVTPARAVDYSYAEGTKLARLLYRLSHNGTISQEEMVTRILDRLPQLTATLIRDYDDKVYDFETIVPILLGGLSLNADSCEALRESIGKNSVEKEFPACAGT